MAVNMKSVIADTFMALSKTKDVDKITVMDLVKACHISRQTFYYHFQDILEVIEWSVQQAFQECQRRFDFVIFRRTGNVRKWRVKVSSL